MLFRSPSAPGPRSRPQRLLPQSEPPLRASSRRGELFPTPQPTPSSGPQPTALPPLTGQPDKGLTLVWVPGKDDRCLWPQTAACSCCLRGKQDQQRSQKKAREGWGWQKDWKALLSPEAAGHSSAPCPHGPPRTPTVHTPHGCVQPCKRVVSSPSSILLATLVQAPLPLLPLSTIKSLMPYLSYLPLTTLSSFFMYIF